MINEKELKVQMIRHGDNNKDLSKALGIKPPTLCHRLKGRSPFKVNEIQVIIDRYSLTPELTQLIFFT